MQHFTFRAAMKKILIAISLFLLVLGKLNGQTSGDEALRIATFCKVWGFLKYYHPAVAKGTMDWDSVFLSRMGKLKALSKKEEINNFYITWLESLGKVEPCKKCRNDLSPNALTFNLDLDWLNDSTEFSPEMMNRLRFIRQNRNQGENYYVKTFPGVGNADFGNELPYKDSVFPSPELRTLGLARYWNMIQYFFPYKYIIGRDWKEVLVEMVPKFTDAKDTVSYHLAMLELTAKINDSHAGFTTKYTNQYFGLKWVPFQYKIIDNKAIVTGTYNDTLMVENDMLIGDVVLKSGNRDIGEIIREKSKFVGASNEATQLRNFRNYLFNGDTDSVQITFDRNGKVFQKTIGRYLYPSFHYPPANANPADTFKMLGDNIGYVNMGLLQPGQVDGLFKQFEKTRAIIFDVRNYPNSTLYNISYHLNPDRVSFAKFSVPDPTYPGVFTYTKTVSAGGKNKNHYRGRVVLLFNETSQSHAEFTLMALKTAPDVIGIGSQTAGADGNVSVITFPGNFKTFITGIGVYYPDGKETQRIGIVPDIEVKPTISGIRAGRDEVLEKALEVLSVK